MFRSKEIPPSSQSNTYLVVWSPNMKYLRFSSERVFSSKSLPDRHVGIEHAQSTAHDFWCQCRGKQLPCVTHRVALIADHIVAFWNDNFFPGAEELFLYSTVGSKRTTHPQHRAATESAECLLCQTQLAFVVLSPRDDGSATVRNCHRGYDTSPHD